MYIDIKDFMFYIAIMNLTMIKLWYGIDDWKDWLYSWSSFLLRANLKFLFVQI